MKKTFLAFIGIIFCFFLGNLCEICAEEEASSDVNWKEELNSDRQQIREQRQEMKQNAQEARTEEKELRRQIQDAMAAGDTETANQLKEQIRAAHQENVQEMRQDKKELQEDRKELKQDRKAKWDSLTPEEQEKIKTHRKDLDNNPPGPKGGPGTNWENRPGPKDGPGAGPDRKPKIDRDNNPPGLKGGPGTNWENKPGPQGGPGASPNRKPMGNSRPKAK